MLKKIILNIIKVYQTITSWIPGKSCRFYPSCSEYTYLSIKKYGLLTGLFKGIKRVLRCHPLSLGGIDPP